MQGGWVWASVSGGSSAAVRRRGRRLIVDGSMMVDDRLIGLMVDCGDGLTADDHLMLELVGLGGLPEAPGEGEGYGEGGGAEARPAPRHGRGVAAVSGHA